jgi:hypothetical protein
MDAFAARHLLGGNMNAVNSTADDNQIVCKGVELGAPLVSVTWTYGKMVPDLPA